MGLKLRNTSGGSTTLRDLSTENTDIEIDVRNFGSGSGGGVTFVEKAGKAWITDTTYKTGDIVSYNNEIYISKSDHTSGHNISDAPGNNITNWIHIDISGGGATGNVIQGGGTAWALRTDYRIGDIVVYQSEIYISRTDHNSGSNTNDTPNTNATVWKFIDINTGGGTVPDHGGRAWSAGIDYKSGDIVADNEEVFIARIAHTSTAGGNAGRPSSSTSINWTTIQAAIVYEQGGVAWQSGVAYRAGDIVTDSATAYISKILHTSASSGNNGKPTDPLATRWHPVAVGHDSIFSFNYVWDNLNVTNVAAGKISVNSSSSRMYIHKLQANGTNMATFIEDIKEKDWFNLFNEADPYNSMKFFVTGRPTLNGDVYTIPVVSYVNVGTFSIGLPLGVFWKQIEYVEQGGMVWDKDNPYSYGTIVTKERILKSGYKINDSYVSQRNDNKNNDPASDVVNWFTDNAVRYITSNIQIQIGNGGDFSGSQPLQDFFNWVSSIIPRNNASITVNFVGSHEITYPIVIGNTDLLHVHVIGAKFKLSGSYIPISITGGKAHFSGINISGSTSSSRFLIMDGMGHFTAADSSLSINLSSVNSGFKVFEVWSNSYLDISNMNINISSSSTKMQTLALIGYNSKISAIANSSNTWSLNNKLSSIFDIYSASHCTCSGNGLTASGLPGLPINVWDGSVVVASRSNVFLDNSASIAKNTISGAGMYFR